MTWEVRQGDCLSLLRAMPAESVQCVVTSPPYWGLRDYGTATWEGGDAECDHAIERPDRAQRPRNGLTGGLSYVAAQDAGTTAQSLCKCGAHRIDSQLGLEPTPGEYVQNLVNVFREVRRVMRPDATAWLNLGDSFMAGKQLAGIPWRVAFALQNDGWILRSDIIWAKKNCMPESVTDRPTRSHEYIFLLTKSARYFYDADAVREELTEATIQRDKSPRGRSQNGGGSVESMAGYDYGRDGLGDMQSNAAGRNKRSVWHVATRPYSEAHFATFPPKLIEPCILAGSAPKACGECGSPWERTSSRSVPTFNATEDPTRITGRKGMNRQRQGVARQLIFVESQRALAHRIRAVAGDRLPEWREEFDAMCGGPGNFNHWIRTEGSSGNYPPLEAVERLRELGVEVATVETPSGELRSSCSHPNDSGQSLVLDPFCGSGTTGMVALRHNRSFIGLELSPEYVEMARHRIRDDAPLLNYGLEAA